MLCGAEQALAQRPRTPCPLGFGTARDRGSSESVEAPTAQDLTSFTAPERAKRSFAYSPTNVLRWYTPPQPDPPLVNPSAVYSYYLDGQLARITRPDGQQINLTYDPETGQLLATEAGSHLDNGLTESSEL